MTTDGNDPFADELKVHGNWVLAALDSHVFLPTKVTPVAFRGHRLYLIPGTDTQLPAIAVNMTRGTQSDGQRLLFHFLSSLSWVEGQGVQVVRWSGGSLPFRVGRGLTARLVNDQLDFDYFPDPTDTRTRWALAFYREGLSLSNVAYAALSFFKIINILAPTGKEQKQWMNAALPALSDRSALERVKELTAEGVGDIGAYLYQSGRCAIAHAGEDPTVDPEDPEDTRRLSRDAPLIRALAAYAIEHDLGVKSPQTVYREHLYELAGFKAMLGSSISDRLAQRDPVSVSEVPRLPPLSVRLKYHQPLTAFENMAAEVMHVRSGRVGLLLHSPREHLSFRMRLHVPAERLEFDWTAFSCQDDGSEAAIRDQIDCQHFVQRYLANGMLQVFNAENGDLLGRCDAYIPLNIIPTDAGDAKFAAQIEALENEADRRRESDAGRRDGEPLAAQQPGPHGG